MGLIRDVCLRTVIFCTRLLALRMVVLCWLMLLENFVSNATLQ